MTVPSMVFEDQFAALNETYFFREFTYSKSTFFPAPTRKVELADSLIWLGDFLVVFQLKERKAEKGTTPEAEKRWFEREVQREATRQVRNTIAYLEESKGIELCNHKGHAFTLVKEAIREHHKLVVYLPHESLPNECYQIKHHRSRTAGFIHILQAVDYLGIVQTLVTPAEVRDYLNFREALINVWEKETLPLSEKALVGQYLKGDPVTRPSNDFTEYLYRLNQRSEEWDLSGLIKTFPDRPWLDNRPTDYYSVVREIALLMRNELREFKKRFQLSFEKARANEAVYPYRMACPRTDCGFVFIPLTKDEIAHRRSRLTSITLAHKYEQKLLKCIGVSFVAEEDGWFKAEWCYAESPWIENQEVETILKENNPFRAVKDVIMDRYTFDKE